MIARQVLTVLHPDDGVIRSLRGGHIPFVQLSGATKYKWEQLNRDLAAAGKTDAWKAKAEAAGGSISISHHGHHQLSDGLFYLRSGVLIHSQSSAYPRRPGAHHSGAGARHNRRLF